MCSSKISDWLEDSSSRRFSRYAVADELSTWVCNDCGQADADPHLSGCEACGAEAESY